MSDQKVTPEQKQATSSTPVPPHKTTIKVMVIIIVMLLICIATRWEYVKKEVTDALNSRFKTEQKK